MQALKVVSILLSVLLSIAASVHLLLDLDTSPTALLIYSLSLLFIGLGADSYGKNSKT